ncbi:unnamed protein product [Cochlearia groenlandica]
MSSHFFLFFFMFLVIITTIVDVILANDDTDKTQSTDNNNNKPSAKNLIDSLGPSQDYSDYKIPKELAPDGVEVVDDYMPISPKGGQENANPLAQPEPDMNVKTSPSSSGFRSSLTILEIVVIVGGATLFFF